MIKLFVKAICVLIIGVLWVGCSSDGTSSADQTESISTLNAEIDSLKAVVSSNERIIKIYRDSIALLKYPADQRLAKIKALIKDEDYAEASSQIAKLQSVFPNSSEAEECNALQNEINLKIEAKEAERQRVLALGFKALKTESRINVGYNTVTISNISVDKTFVHDTYGTYSGSSWYYNTADRGNKYITAAMSVTSTSKNPNIPTLAFYNVKGNLLELQGVFRIEMARWDDYGTYLGNYNDNNNDFSKVSTVKFKLGCELPEEDFSKPYIVVLKKDNTHSRSVNRFHTPPVSYSGEHSYPQVLTLDDFEDGNYVAVKIANL